MTSYDEKIRIAQLAVRAHGTRLLGDPNVHGVGVGHKEVSGLCGEEPCVKIVVSNKLPSNRIPLLSRLPRLLTVGDLPPIPTDVVEASAPFPQGAQAPAWEQRRLEEPLLPGGLPAAAANVERIRPVRPGTSVAELGVTAGTLGAIVMDNKTKELLVLSNNHVLSNFDKAPLGSPVLQPGPFDGGQLPDDTVASLLRWVPLSTQENNLVDAAVARLGSPSLARNEPLNDVPAPSTSHPAYGLHWGGDGKSYSLCSPINSVLRLLDVSFPDGGAVAVPRIGTKVQKTGRTTGKTEGQITEINYMTHYTVGGERYCFVDQIRLTFMTEGGDSGSLIVGV